MTIRKWLYRQKIKRMTMRYLRMREDYDCGEALFHHICLDAAVLWKQIEKGVARLKAWDSTNG